ncbi:hypothetical protein M432DRAFT_630541 [Thermoascus aurantiacus ATCC 26904]
MSLPFGLGKGKKSPKLLSGNSSSLRNLFSSKRSPVHSPTPDSDHYNSDSLWAPPPYSEAPPPPAPAASSSANQSRSSGDSPYAFLAEFDTVFVVDDSLSMEGPRWKEAEAAIAAITPICVQYDPDGIDIYFLNHRSRYGDSGAYTNVTTAAAVREIFQSVRPSGCTPFGKRLHQILRPYLQRVEAMAAATDEDGELRDPPLAVRPLNIIAITDGEFSDDAESVIVAAAKRLDSDRCKAVPWQVGIQFFQIGNDEDARQFLQELDDGLAAKVRDHNLRDIVDTVPWRGESGQTLTGEGILKVVLGAVHKRYDKREAVHG